MILDQETRSGGSHCRECGVENRRDAVVCWLCHRHDWRNGKSYSSPRHEILANARGWIVLAGLVVVLVGLFPQAPFPAGFLLCTVVPALLITEIQALIGKRQGIPLSSRDRLATVLGYTMALMAVAGFLLAVGVAFGIICIPLS